MSVVDEDGNEVGPDAAWRPSQRERNTLWLLAARAGVPIPEIAAAWRVRPSTVRENVRRERLTRAGKPPVPRHMNFDAH